MQSALYSMCRPVMKLFRDGAQNEYCDIQAIMNACNGFERSSILTRKPSTSLTLKLHLDVGAREPGACCSWKDECRLVSARMFFTWARVLCIQTQ